MYTKWTTSFWLIHCGQDLQYSFRKALWQIFLCWFSPGEGNGATETHLHLTLLLLQHHAVPGLWRLCQGTQLCKVGANVPSALQPTAGWGKKPHSPMSPGSQSRWRPGRRSSHLVQVGKHWKVACCCSNYFAHWPRVLRHIFWTLRAQLGLQLASLIYNENY